MKRTKSKFECLAKYKIFKMILSIRREKYVRLFETYFTCYHSSNSSGAKLLHSSWLYAWCLELNFNMCSIVLYVFPASTNICDIRHQERTAVVCFGPQDGQRQDEVIRNFVYRPWGNNTWWIGVQLYATFCHRHIMPHTRLPLHSASSFDEFQRISRKFHRIIINRQK